jgi:hypothetical protein
MVRTWSSMEAFWSLSMAAMSGRPPLRSTMGDFDFGLRSSAAGDSVWLARGAVGTCTRSLHEELIRLPWAGSRLWSTNELAAGPWAIHTRRWAVPVPPTYWISLCAERGGHGAGARLRRRTKPPDPRRLR